MEDSEHGCAMSIGNTKLRKALKLAAWTAGGVAAGYAVFKYYKWSNTETRAREREVDIWFKARLTQLQATLALSDEQLDWLRIQITAIVSLGNRIWRKAEKLSASDLDKAMLSAEKHLVKIKMRIRKMLEIAEEDQLAALHAFYEELRLILLGLTPPAESDISRSAPAEM